MSDEEVFCNKWIFIFLVIYVPRFDVGPMTRRFLILLVDLVLDDILQMALGPDLLRKFGGGIPRSISTNAICCIFGLLVAMPLSTKRITKKWTESL